ncbi:PREDICTED: uncharacterized protein LOC105954376 [Erythranthe guttata]|nr:PREDICTED: uncharacterized protein LOC105954376 [Erythranthe guttata]|eukprot:XP_012833499.1 PREDICTED: uncharacterized protein LOC105954376 [Erythranthe guttata]
MGCRKQVVCSCDGVLLVADYFKRRYVLSNPSTRAEIKLRFPYKFSNNSIFHGLCRDPTNGNFKVVILTPKYYAVYSCTNNSWTDKKEYPSNGRLLFNKREVIVNGSTYWIWRRDNNVEEILYIDPRDDMFKFIKTPKNVEHGKRIYVVSLKGFLCMYCYGRDETEVRIWIKGKGLDNNSWNELMTVENVRASIDTFRPLCFLENKIVIRVEVKEIAVYDPCEKTFEVLNECRYFHDFGLIPYTESLFFPRHVFLCRI